MTAFVASLLFVTLAEMGDKTQLLAMAFATRFRPQTVLAAVFVATLLNHALAVAAGQLLTNAIPVNVITLVAAFSFVLFGLWTIRGDTLEGEDQRPTAFGPFMTVAIAFFLAEIGDKTQLTTISLAVKYPSPAAVLMGTTTGMVVADGLGILVGATLGKRLPDALIRLVSAGVFIGFGLVGVGAVLPSWMPPSMASVAVMGLAAVTLVAAHALFLKRLRLHGHAVAPAAEADLPRPASQLLFIGLLLLGWTVGLGRVPLLAAVDHWFAFALLAGLGWKLIHGVVRLRLAPQMVGSAPAALVLLLTALSFVDALVPGAPLAWIVAPAVLLLSAGFVLTATPMIARRRPGRLATRLAESRVTIGSGLLLVGIATQILIEHLR
jgi:putative Ca2+/H+ antiporter (TMEM165/GDT1 family)